MILTRLPPGEWNTSQDYGPLARAQEKCTLYPRQQTVPREGSSCWKCRAGAACWVGTSQWRKYAMQECRALIQICKGMQLEAMWRDKKLREDIGDDPSQWAKRLKGAFGNASHVQVNSDDPEPSGNSHTESEAETSPSFGCTSLACVLHNVLTDASRRFVSDISSQVGRRGGWSHRKTQGKRWATAGRDVVELLIGIMTQSCTCLGSPSLPHQLHRHVDSFELPGSYCPTEQNVYLPLVMQQPNQHSTTAVFDIWAWEF